jgi:hypothetical protein
MSLPTMTTANYLWMVFAIVVFGSLWLYLPKLRNIHPSSNPNYLQHLDIPQILPTHQNLTITVKEIQIQQPQVAKQQQQDQQEMNQKQQQDQQEMNQKQQQVPNQQKEKLKHHQQQVPKQKQQQQRHERKQKLQPQPQPQQQQVRKQKQKEQQQQQLVHENQQQQEIQKHQQQIRKQRQQKQQQQEIQIQQLQMEQQQPLKQQKEIKKQKEQLIINNTIPNQDHPTIERKRKGKLRQGKIPRSLSTLNRQVYTGPITQAHQIGHVNKTKIVGFISSHYIRVALRWHDRLETLGYTNHYIICTDNKSFDILQTNFPAYRIEASYLPEFPASYASMKYGFKERHRVEMLFAHRWVYLLEQLKLGYHILLTDIDNIFSSYYSMNELELSEFDVYHALETKHPQEVYKYQGFVVCGGMGWFRSSPRSIRYVEEMVKRCGWECDDQVQLNNLIAYGLHMKWNRSSSVKEHSTAITVNSSVIHGDDNERLEERLEGLITVGFTGYSISTGVKIKLWDRAFAYRGKATPKQCPSSSQNWVSMPFVTSVVRWQTPLAKLKAYDLWDNHCPNQYSNLTWARPKKNYQNLPGLSSL